MRWATRSTKVSMRGENKDNRPPIWASVIVSVAVWPFCVGNAIVIMFLALSAWSRVGRASPSYLAESKTASIMFSVSRHASNRWRKGTAKEKRTQIKSAVSIKW